MHEKQKELHHLKKMLATTRLTALDRNAIEARIEGLSQNRRSDDRPQPTSSYVLGVFDRPKPERITPSSTQPQPRAAIPLREEHVAPSQPPSEEPEVIAPTPAPSLPSEEMERLSRQLVEIAERIALLRQVWATTLAFEVDQEAEAWLARL